MFAGEQENLEISVVLIINCGRASGERSTFNL